MKAIAIVPGRLETAGVIDMPEPRDSDGSVLVSDAVDWLVRHRS